ncbi:proto-oncogene tyrosine-protein kinase ROS isoform X2 [Coccinella septempunctata]|uniref:proto-oncogene tyrosine-protein kinase ROS isoform X2 n=1 Tax=Coccinella septempunctata TaxID=41139 RepID=UPI001D08CC52|nr:proto-oncogene tyrosine-protein kinase ROS isoform X2 [Coccinella septempunctata]
MTKMRSTLIIVCFVLRTIRADLDLLDLDVENECVKHCPVQNSTDLEHYDYTCDVKCNEEQCVKGCRLWKQALSSSCPKICNGFTNRIKTRDYYCVTGCNSAVATYFTLLAKHLGTPPPPALVADSLNSTSLKLEWNFPAGRRKGLTSYIQWQYQERPEDWQNCPNITWNERGNIVLVDNLRPYTKYRFRVALIPIFHGQPIISSSSVLISTLRSGVPESKPIIVRHSAVDFTRISVRWEPGPFPHGPILSYVLQITDNNQVHSEVKEMAPGTNYYIFRNLAPNTNYNVSISMRNSVGIGPSAQVTISTPPEPSARHSKKPILILGTEHSVIKQGAHIIDEPVLLYETEKQIKGLAVHISKKLLFVSESDGHVAKMSMETNITTYILTPDQINFMPLDLSVDWLNDQIYILGAIKFSRMYLIARCNLDGSGLTVAIAGLPIKPHCMEVDPYNGYLFWAIKGSTKGGIHRLDLADISNGIRHEVRPEIIFKDENLGAFTLDHTNFSILVARQRNNTINSISLDGKEVYDMRPKVIKSKMHKVVSLATANKIFYWTDGVSIFYEEHRNAYYHNSYPDLSPRTYHKVIVNLESSQPIPIPVNPPRNLQAMFGNHFAKVSWEAPHLLDGQGRGAWQNWSYEVSLKNIITNEKTAIKEINGSSCTVQNLAVNSKYLIKTAAYTTYGRGPWSREFIGATLLNKKEEPFILWAAAEGLLRSDPTGQSVKTMIHIDEMKHTVDMKHFFITNIAWYQQHIYMVTNNSQVFWYDSSTRELKKLIDYVGSIGIDWIGKKLYWYNHKQQMMIRGNLNGTMQEPLSITDVVRELEIDSVKAYIYWSTGYDVECAHLNGVDKIDYRKDEFYSGKQVMGLTLDMDHKNLYWIVRGSEGSSLFKAPMAGYIDTKHITVEKIANLRNPVEGPLSYFHNRLLWLQDNKTAMVSDLLGQNIATLKEATIKELTTVYVVDPTFYKLPETDTIKVEDIVVIPNIVQRNSVKVTGTSSSFNVSWSPVDNVNYGTVFYEVQIDNMSHNNSTIITTHPSVKYWQKVTPYTKLNMSIRAFTYWGTSPEMKANIFSPPSTPSEPRNTRTYVQNMMDNEKNVTIRFRWDTPLYPNGIIQGYRVFCWYYHEGAKLDICHKVIKRPEEMEHVVQNVNRNETYFFEVRAFTKIGDGKMSEPLLVNAKEEFPLPTLLIASADSIYVQDIDANRNYSLLHGLNSPMEMGYLMKENKIFWINEMKELYMYTTTTLNKTKILDIGGNATGLTIDWLERSVYFVVTEGKYSMINKIDLNLYEKGLLQPVEVLRRPFNISKLEISPFTRKLYWIEVEDKTYFRLMESNVDGGRIIQFFSRFDRTKRFTDEMRDKCNCPLNPAVESSFSIDHSNTTQKPLFTFIDHNSKNILSSDKEGCECDVIANYSTVSNYLPVEKIKSDFGSLYWTNQEQGNLYVLKRQKEPTVVSREVRALDISIFGHHIQPHPSKQCLAPKQNKASSVILGRRKSSSLHLILPDYQIHENCSGVSLATVQYTLCYSEETEACESCMGDCHRIDTFSKEIEIRGLHPYTKYKIWVSYGNHFTKSEDRVVGPVVVLQTAPGAPSKPVNVTATVLNPTLAEVTWKPPLKLNGETVFYEVHWQTEGTRSGVRKKEEQPVQEHQTTENTQKTFKSFLHKLSPNETYTVWIRAYCENNATSTDSEKVKIVTYPEPSGINLLNKTSQTMSLSWNNSQHVQSAKIQYSTPISDHWLNATLLEQKKDVLYFHVKDLQPKSFYRFRLSLIYEKYKTEFVWPLDSKFTFETLGDRPSPPGIPIIQYMNPNEYKVWWETARENGAPIELYRLEGLLLKHYRTRRSTNRTAFFYTAPSIIEEEPQWKTFYNGTNTSWIINGLSEDYKYVFRVFALNSFGWSDPSKESIEFDLNETARLADKQSAMTVVIIATGITISFIFIVIIVLISLLCTSKKKEPQVIHIPRAPDVELATLRELPRRGVHNTNVLYVSTQPTPEEIKLLPHIKREQITLTKFLGSGAFGEVFEGKAKDIPGHTKVAIKTLRKGASDQEKTEFLQEAQLMSHFKHEHILELLGVCLDNDPHFIIMELMQGGDLLTYLRSSRKPVTNTPMLTLIELLKMCVDVARGCRYLEEMHFVHRDLACRNCLVSSTDPEVRIVKIGDFGLARDIYKNDYYRKEGEGLLPVRWMAPESLMDGVFTSQSDVWAFGVLLWEIMTLGQQPYPARNNLEVLHYVKSGGRLGKPVDCPVELHSLMLQCWLFTPDSRPTFKYCLEVLEDLHQQNLRNPTTGAHVGEYISTVPEYTSWKSDQEEDKEKTPFLISEGGESECKTTESVPKYLELLCDPASSLENEGYEIPNQMINDTLDSEDSKKTLKITSPNNSKKKI